MGSRAYRRWQQRRTSHAVLHAAEARDGRRRRETVCGHLDRRSERGVGIVVGGGSAAVGAGLLSCGCVWTCPVCSARIRAVRGSEVTRAQVWWEGLDADHHVALMTLTLSHQREDELAEVLRRFAYRPRRVAGMTDAEAAADRARAGAWVRLQKSHWWAGRAATKTRAREAGWREAAGIAGSIRALEIRYGEAGWHAHYHVLLLLERAWTEDELAAHVDRLKREWCAAVAAAGGTASYEHGADLRVFRRGDVAAAYLTKGEGPEDAGQELTNTEVKLGKRGSVGPFALVDADATEDLRALGVSPVRARELWLQYVDQIRGRHLLDWSAGLKARVGIEEISDEEAAGEGDDNVAEVGTIEGTVWEQRLGPSRPERVREVLREVGRGDWAMAAAVCGPGVVALPPDELRVGWRLAIAQRPPTPPPPRTATPARHGRGRHGVLAALQGGQA